MDPVTSVSAATNTQQTQTSAAALGQAAGPSSLDYEAFLRLLVTQMQNQDPLNPMDDTEYIAQLATFSNVEQNIITNQRLEAVLTAQALGDAGALIGRTVTMPSGESGVVQQVQVTANGTIAVMEDGTKVTLGQGATIS
ncbi:flagellar hook assembly protein FlgD [Acuticoccus sp. I52.16.1]|uniref:flagellar hook assembly protein FlgD n=1 Tax=Acuticoccus sp. I52.16.1 TaxID=2928472 RepID=UPI001FD579A3|nr:flagellar hook assembly protein FlgD [Acuticoccus sp. I52.16.1]UOM34939.1 flagellar hook assembly protein FlgD [Acuticoccus sp. I52.16.1]